MSGKISPGGAKPQMQAIVGSDFECPIHPFQGFLGRYQTISYAYLKAAGISSVVDASAFTLTEYSLGNNPYSLYTIIIPAASIPNSGPCSLMVSMGPDEGGIYDFQMDFDVIDDPNNGFDTLTNYISIRHNEDCNPALTDATHFADQILAGTDVDHIYKGCLLMIMSGTGAGQVRMISDNVNDVGSGDIVFTLDEPWTVIPTSGSAWCVLPAGRAQVNEILAGPLASIATAVWGAATRTLSAATNITAGIATAVWAIATSGLTGAGTIGKWLMDQLNFTYTAPDNTSIAAIKNALIVATGTARAGTSTTIQLATSASGIAEFYTGCLIVITSGTGVGQAKVITSYDNSTKTAYISDELPWATPPSSGSVYVILPMGQADTRVTNWTGFFDNFWNYQIDIDPPYGPLTAGAALEGAYVKTLNIASDVWSYATRVLTASTNITAGIATAVWANSTRTLSSFGTLVADIWAYVTRTITSGGITAAEVWSYGNRTLTSLGNLIDAITSTINNIWGKVTNLPASPASTGDVTGATSTITAAISALNNVSTAQVLTQVTTGLTNFGAAKTTDVTAARAIITAAISALNNISQAQVLTQVGTGLTNYTAATAANITAAVSALEGVIAALNNLSTTQAQAAAAAALTAYNAAKVTDVHVYESEDITT